MYTFTLHFRYMLCSDSTISTIFYIKLFMSHNETSIIKKKRFFHEGCSWMNDVECVVRIVYFPISHTNNMRKLNVEINTTDEEITTLFKFLNVISTPNLQRHLIKSNTRTATRTCCDCDETRHIPDITRTFIPYCHRSYQNTDLNIIGCQ